MARKEYIAVNFDKPTLELIEKIRREVQTKLGINLSRQSVVQYLIKFYEDHRE